MRLLSSILGRARTLVRRGYLAAPRINAAVDASTIDLASPAVAGDPFPYYELLRRGGPVQFLTRHGYWIVLGYDEVEAAFAQPAVFSNSPYAEVDRVLLGADPPQHTAVRRIMTRYFTAATVQRLGAAVEATAARLIKRRFDVVSEYGDPLSRTVASELLGFDDDALDAIADASAASLQTPSPLEAFTQALDALADRATLFRTLIKDAEGTLAEAEVRSLIRLLWLAATMTTQRTITRAILRLLQHDDVRMTVTSNPSLVPAFVEEVLRLHPPEHIVPRFTMQEAELGGIVIPAGATVQLCASAANRDPLRFEEPAALRLNRTQVRHFTFGSGIHRCIGAPIARAVVCTAVRALLERAPRFRALQPLNTIPYFKTPSALAAERLMIGS